MPKLLLSTTFLCGSLIVAGPALAQTASYCDEGYKVADTNNDNMISQDELQAARDAEFEDMDLNGDGTVSRQEYSDCMGAWAANSAVEPADEDDLAEFDADGDGTVTVQEFMGGTEKAAAMQPTGDTTQQTSASTDTSGTEAQGGNAVEPIAVLRRIIIVPQAYDDDRVRSMSQDEMAARSAQRFVTTDADGDLKISREEWIDMGKDHINKVTTVLNREFDNVDKDKSGDVSRMEYYEHGLDQWNRAQLSAKDKATMQGDETGAPVIYFRFPSTM